MINTLLWLLANRESILSQAEKARMLSVQVEPQIQRLRPLAGEFADALKILAASVRQRRARLPERERAALRTLAENGWYVDGGLSPRDVVEVADAFERGDRQPATDELCVHIASREPEIEDDLRKRFSGRAGILSDAFAAHRSGKYTLSVPIFLIQAEGFVYDLCGRQLYKKQGKPLAAYLRKRGVSEYDLSLLEPVLTRQPLTEGSRRGSDGRRQLNRHAVVHGVSVDYGSQLNSYQAISLLSFLAWAFVAEGMDETG